MSMLIPRATRYTSSAHPSICTTSWRPSGCRNYKREAESSWYWDSAKSEWKQGNLLGVAASLTAIALLIIILVFVLMVWLPRKRRLNAERARQRQHFRAKNGTKTTLTNAGWEEIGLGAWHRYEMTVGETVKQKWDELHSNSRTSVR